MADLDKMSDDEKHLAKLGYSQELNRSWSGFSNFAISFSIISILAGCFTNFGAGFNNGGPISISWSWPILGVFILIIGFTMSELVSAYPTSGGIYWWASKLGGPAAGFFTGWLNLIGLVAVTAGVSYGCATFIDLTISTWSECFAADYSLTRVFVIFLIVLALVSVLNIFSSHLMAIMNNVSVWWHVVGASAIVLILLFVPDQHQSFSYVFTERFNNSGYFGGETGTLGFWFAIVPVRLPADAVHDHRLRRLRPPVGGDRVGVDGGGQGHLAVDPLLRDRRLHPAADRRLRDPGRRVRQPRQRRRGRGRRRVHLRAVDGRQLGGAGALHLGVGTVLLRDLVHDLGVADDLRVQP